MENAFYHAIALIFPLKSVAFQAALLNFFMAKLLDSSFLTAKCSSISMASIN